EICVPQGQACDCSKGQNAFACTWNDPTWGSWTECLPTSGPNSYCPSDCPTGEVACDLVEDYLPNGTSLGFVTPSVKCATSHENCPCGKEAERCPNTGCIFKDEGCPVTCGANEKKCYLSDYTGNGEFISDRETCVAADATCPCGKNTAKCANTDLCLTTAEAAIVCPCKASETECLVVDYDKNGEATGFTTQCVKEGQSCPCGKNTLSCPDPNDALAKLCAPSFNTKKCPEPCTADAIAAGNITCVQTNMNSQGKFKSETVTCIGANSTCPAGEGMKNCLSGATISVKTACMNLYATGTNTRRLTSSSTATRETCNAIVTMTSLGADATKNAETARVLQIPSGLKTTLAVKAATRFLVDIERGRLKEKERALNSGGTIIYGIDNQGERWERHERFATSVSPSQVCEQLKKMVKSSNPSLTEAVSGVGVINAQVRSAYAVHGRAGQAERRQSGNLLYSFAESKPSRQGRESRPGWGDDPDHHHYDHDDRRDNDDHDRRDNDDHDRRDDDHGDRDHIDHHDYAGRSISYVLVLCPAGEFGEFGQAAQGQSH
ncbi:Uncharacterized protein SCF082_LOCUS4750, partial [Durusdinium trenchii]